MNLYGYLVNFLNMLKNNFYTAVFNDNTQSNTSILYWFKMLLNRFKINIK